MKRKTVNARIFPRLVFVLLSVFGAVGAFAQTVVIPPADELILPQVSINGGTTASRLQYVCRLRLSGLTANATYRYFTGASTNAAITTSSAPGNFFAINNATAPVAGYITGHSSNKSMSGGILGASPNENEFTSSGRYCEFVTDASGSYTGWFGFVPTSNAVFNAGGNVYIYVQLNNGAGGTAITTSYRTTSTVHMINYGTTSGNADQATALRGTSNSPDESIILIYDNTAGTGRPVYGTWTENDGVTTNFTTWYNAVEGVSGSWGAVIPNNVTNGIRRIEARDIATANVIGCPSLDADGNWPTANTVNASSGVTPLVIATSDAPIFPSASNNGPVCPGTTINLSCTAGSAYNWSGPASFTSTSATPSITNAAFANAGTYSVTVTDANGCNAQATTTVSVNSSVTATVSGGGTVCSGNTTTVSIALSGAGPWDFTYSDGTNSTPVTGQATSPYTITTGTAGVYTVTALSSNGCTGTASGSATVTVTPLPTAPTVTPASPTIAAYNVITLTASGTGTFNWYTQPSGGTAVFTGASYTPTPFLTTTTTFYVDATTGGCTSVRTPVTVTVTANPVTFTQYVYHTPPALGTYHGVDIPFGGFSGLHYIPGTNNEFYSITDRGPNLDANNNVHANGNPNAKLFPLPNFTPTIVHFKTQGDSIVVLNTIPVKRPNGTNTTGLILPANAGGTGELAFTDTSGALGTPDTWGIDCEGIAEGNDTDLWVSEEYATSIWRINKTNGQVINRYTPYFGTVGAQPEDLRLDSVFKYRNPNKGLEGVAYAPNGKVYGFIQNMVFFPASAASAIKSNSRLHRFVEIDPVTGVTRMFGYEHDAVPTSPNYGSTINNGNRYIGDAVAINDHEFLVLEHGKSSTQTYCKVYKIDINGATPITQATYGGLTFEQMYTAATAQSNGITCVTKTLVADLIGSGYDVSLDKQEGLTIVNDSTIAIANDNDFGVVSPNADGNIQLTGVKTTIYLFHLPQHLNLCLPAHISAASATTFCSGGGVTLSTPALSGATYQWSLNNNPIVGATSQTYAATASGNYSVGVTDTQGCLANTTTIAVNVLPQPTATVTAGGPTTFCTGSNVTLQSSTGSGNTYQWLLNGNPIGGATASTYTANASGDYSVQVTNSSSCNATSTNTTVTVNALPTATVTAGGPTTFCAGSNVVLQSSTGSGYTYQWKLNGNNISGATSATYTATASGNYSVVTTNASGCSATSAATTITVNPAPNTAISMSGPAAFCAGGGLTLQATIASGNTYQWQQNGSPIVGATNSSYTATTAAFYNVIITNASGCTATSGNTTVTIYPAAQAVVSPASANICQGDTAQLNAQVSNGNLYQWQLYNTAIIGATFSSYNAMNAGNYVCIVTNSSGCSDTSAIVPVTVNALPAQPAISQSGNVLSTVAGYTYQWYLNGVAIPGAVYQNDTITQPGNYTVEITNGNGCSNMSTAYAATITGIVNAAQISGATVYPNPFTSEAQLELQLSSGGMVRIDVYSLLGEHIATIASGNESAGKHSYALGTAGWSSTVYLVKIVTPAETKIIRVVKQ